MASSLDKDNMDLKAESTDGNCLLETEYSKSDPEGDRARKYSGRNKRILYDRVGNGKRRFYRFEF